MGTSTSTSSSSSSLWSRSCDRLYVPEFGKMTNLGIAIFYLFMLSQCFIIFDCRLTYDDPSRPTIYRLRSDPNTTCFTKKNLIFSILAGIMLLICTYLPYKIYDGLRYELQQSNHSQLEHEKNMGFLYMKYKPEYYWWEPVVEMSRKYLIVVFAIFMPTGQLQAIASMVITLIYWGLHAKYLPYRTDWKDADGNPADPDLENNLQHYMYAIQVVIVIVMMSHESYKKDPDVGGAILLFIYFTGVAFLGYSILRTTVRQIKRNKIIPTNEEEDKEAGKLSKSVQMAKKVFDAMGNDN